MSLRRASNFPLTLPALLGAAAALFIHVQNARAEEDALSQQVRTVFEHAKNAVVKVEAIDEHGSLSGTGFFVDPNGTLYTCYSVGGESRDIVVCNGELKYTATRIAADRRSGIAILKVEADKVPFLPLGKSRDLHVASMVVTIGYPLDLPVAPNAGCVGGFDLKNGGRHFVASHIRANVPVQRGEGGGPLLNMNGEAVGILVSSFDNNSGCFALPIEAAEKVRKDFMRFGEVRPGWLGIKFGKAPNEADGSLVQVEDFMEDAPAAKSGIEKGDILLQVADSQVKTPDDVLNAAFYLTAGDEVPIKVLRKGETLNFQVKPGEHPGMPHHTAAVPTSSSVVPPLKSEQ